MYTRTARFYDAIYSFKNYREEVDELLKLFAALPDGRSILDVACGSGRHGELLVQRYEVSGVDLDPVMVEQARIRLGAERVSQGNMLDFNLEQAFDVVMCLFSSVGYLASTAELDRAVANFAKHCRTGGMVLVEPWILPENFVDGRLDATYVDEPDLKIARMCIGRKEGDVAVLPLHYLIADPSGVYSDFEEHRLTLFKHEDYLNAFERAGLQVDYNVKGLTWRGLYVGSKVT